MEGKTGSNGRTSEPMGKLGHGKDTTGSRAQQQHASESCFVAKHPVHIHANTEILANMGFHTPVSLNVFLTHSSVTFFLY